jgi:ABC-type branched-subunit amino acid transport system ATPase component
MRTETNVVATPKDSLSVAGISKRFGGLQAASNVSFEIAPGSIHGLIGPNGAGKSTMINIVSGSLRPDAGRVNLGASNVTGIEPSVLARRGLVRTFQQATPLAGLTVLENVLVGLHHHYRSSLLSVSLRTARMRAEAAELLERGLVLLRRFGLQSEAEAPAETLTFGKLRMLELARAVAIRPKFLLLDEPAAGLNGVETEVLATIISELRADGVGVLLVDHDVPFVFKLCDQMTVMNFGTVIASGVPDQVYRDPAVRQAYLGSDDPNAGTVS